MRCQLTLTGVLAATMIAGLATAGSAETWRMAHKQPPESIEGRLFQSFADKIEEKTGGEFTVEVYPAEQLGKDDVILEQLQLGTVHIYPEGVGYLEKWVPAIKYTSAPFIFEDREHWSRFMRTNLVQGWLDEVAEEHDVAVIGDTTAFVRGPYRVMVTSDPFETVDEMAGTKLRMHPNELAAAAWRHLGAEVRTLAWTEVYEAISRGIVEAVNSPIALVEPMRFYEVAPYVIRHNEYPQGMAFMTNATMWSTLDDETREQVLAAHAEVSAESVEAMTAAADESIARMKEEGVTFSTADIASFVAKMRTFYDELDAAGELPPGFLTAVNDTRQPTSN